MRRQRTICFNEARHYCVDAFEPPKTLEDVELTVEYGAYPSAL